MQPHICNTALWSSWTLRAQQSPPRWNIVQDLCSAIAAVFHHSKKKKKACLPAIVLVCSACYAEWNKPPLDWMRIRALWIRLIKRDFLLEPKWLTTLCLWELSGHVYFQVKCKLKLSCQKSSKISEPVTKPRGFNHCPSGISTGSFCIATASTFLTFLPRCSPTPALNCLGAQLLFNLWSISGQ